MRQAVANTVVFDASIRRPAVKAVAPGDPECAAAVLAKVRGRTAREFIVSHRGGMRSKPAGNGAIQAIKCGYRNRPAAID